MVESVSKIWDYILFVIAFIIAIVTFVTQFDNTLEVNISDLTTEFVDECRTTGYISASNYQKFTKDIYAAGNYTIEFEYNAFISYPDDDSPTGYTDGYYTYNTEDVENALFPASGETKNLKLKNKDSLTVTVKRQGKTMSSNLWSFLLGSGRSGQIVVNYSGTVGNSNEE